MRKTNPPCRLTSYQFSQTDISRKHRTLSEIFLCTILLTHLQRNLSNFAEVIFTTPACIASPLSSLPLQRELIRLLCIKYLNDTVKPGPEYGAIAPSSHSVTYLDLKSSPGGVALHAYMYERNLGESFLAELRSSDNLSP